MSHFNPNSLQARQDELCKKIRDHIKRAEAHARFAEGAYERSNHDGEGMKDFEEREINAHAALSNMHAQLAKTDLELFVTSIRSGSGRELLCEEEAK